MISAWRVRPLAELTALLGSPVDGRRPRVIAVDGHSSSGKTSLAGRLVAALPGADLLHTDDLAWYQGVFGWDRLLLDDVLPVVRAGRALDYRPPAWVARGRTDSIRLRGALEFLVVEGVGASQPTLRDAADVVLWVETEEMTRLARDVQRVLVDAEMSAASYTGWMAEENAYVTHTRPYEHAQFVLYGGLTVPHDREREVVVAG